MDWNGIAQNALELLVDEANASFREAAHTVAFPRAQGFLVDEDEQTGDVFARAIIADALLDAARAGFRVAALIDCEVDHLIDSRLESGVGGWKYFPNLRELPPDADDLAQVMQVLIRAGRRDAVERHCERAIEVLLRDNMHADGSFETWIVPGANCSFDEELQQQWIDRAWGRGADSEVTANLLYALALYDRDRFRNEIARGCEFIESRQEPSGAWSSTWYHGPYYGTYVAVRLLAACAPQSQAIERARRFLDAAQPQDALSTALALLAATAMSANVAIDARPLASIEPVPFIRMELGRPTGRPWQTLTYSSTCVTAAFVLKAALARKSC